jgi:hypothetical protein
MSYTMADYRREKAKEHFKDLTPEERQDLLKDLPDGGAVCGPVCGRLDGLDTKPGTPRGLSHNLTLTWRSVPMLETILIVLVVLAAIVVLFAIVVAMQPSEFRIARSATMSAPASDVFAQVNDFHNWEAWSPWAKIDPTMKQTYEGAPAGTGAIYTWTGNNQVGEGTMTLTESRPNDLIRINLEFRRPFKATNTAEFTFKPEAGSTVVTWSMYGRKNFPFKAVGLFMSMDKMVGGDFEKGLAQMKSVVEAKQGGAR